MHITSHRQDQSLIVHVSSRVQLEHDRMVSQSSEATDSSWSRANTTASFLKRVKISNLPFRQHAAPDHHFVQHPTEPGVRCSIVSSPDHRPVMAYIRTSRANFVNTGTVKVDHRLFGTHRPNEMVPFSRDILPQVEGRVQFLPILIRPNKSATRSLQAEKRSFPPAGPQSEKIPPSPFCPW